ncbi:adenylate kinase family protein [Paenibacillus periandrae]|uniref:adenylate kinase family protein n=1 Tax=Paenibacillus periandrae TaxID=1761741 RepID=UPI001F095521|nr:nucleoside monophosphate kinase [Paenibacillus periandrae]
MSSNSTTHDVADQPRIILLGPPASGKSTLFKSLSRIYPDIGHFSVRLFFEREKKLGTRWGELAIPDERGWLPNLLVAEAAEMHIKQHAGRGFVMEGFPASEEQAHLMNEMIRRNDFQIHGIIYLIVNEATSISRANKRMVCDQCDNGVNNVDSENGLCPVCQTPLIKRFDDIGDRFINRLRLHQERIQRVIDILQLPAKTVNAEQRKEVVFQEVLNFLRKGV